LIDRTNGVGLQQLRLWRKSPKSTQRPEVAPVISKDAVRCRTANAGP
jgi:hypothetical protein